MTYSGENLNQCGILGIDCSVVSVVAVSGAGPNICGHLLLHSSGAGGGKYFHVDELRGFPKYMNEAGYRTYLRDSDKTEIRRRRLSLPDPQGALVYLEDLMSKKWNWMVLPNNCVAFVEEVIKAGGGDWSSSSNCPDVATQESLGSRINDFLAVLEGEILRSYGVPQM